MSVDFDSLRCDSHKWKNVATITVGAIVFSCSVFAVFDFLYKWKRERAEQPNSIKPFMIHVTIAGCVCALLAIIGISLTIVGCMLDSITIVHASSIIFTCSYSSIGLILLFMFDYRLYSIFKGSVYAYSDYVFIFLAVIYIIWVCIVIAGPLTIYVGFDFEDNYNNQTISGYIYIVIYAMFFVQANITIILFIRSLFRVCVYKYTYMRNLNEYLDLYCCVGFGICVDVF